MVLHHEFRTSERAESAPVELRRGQPPPLHDVAQQLEMMLFQGSHTSRGATLRKRKGGT
jgi:hypothetical protein